MSPNGTVNFGDVATNASQTVAFGVTNVGQATSGTLNVTLTGADFVLSSNTCTGTLPGGGTCDFVVRFGPTTVGMKNGSVVVSATPGGNLNASLIGNGVTPGNLRIMPVSLDFGNVVQGQTSAPQVFTVTNTGAANTTVPTITIGGSGQGFSQTNLHRGAGAQRQLHRDGHLRAQHRHPEPAERLRAGLGQRGRHRLGERHRQRAGARRVEREPHHPGLRGHHGGLYQRQRHGDGDEQRRSDHWRAQPDDGERRLRGGAGRGRLPQPGVPPG